MTAELVAAGIAPIIDRLRLSIARKMPDRAQTLAAESGIGGPALGTIAMLRNTLPDRVIDADHLYEVFVYTPAARSPTPPGHSSKQDSSTRSAATRTV